MESDRADRKKDRNRSNPEHQLMKKSALLVLILALSFPCLRAQSVSGLLGGAQSKPSAPAQADQLGRDTPSGTVLGFLQAAQSGQYQAAADYLQISAARRPSQGSDLALKLKALMDRAFVGSLRRISTNPEGNPENGPPDQQTIGTFSVTDTDVPVVLVRVRGPNAGQIWLFSSDTLSKVPDLYDNLEAHQVESKLPQILVGHVFLGMPPWQWLALIVAIPVALAIGWAVVLLLAIPRRLYLRYRKRPAQFSYQHISTPLLLCFTAIAHRAIAAYLGLPLLPRFYYSRSIGALVSVGFFWLLFRASGLTMQRLRIHAITSGRIGTGTLMLLGERLIKALVVTLAILVIVAIFGFNLTTILAGLGIGGIAIALAAQKTLENLLGGVSLLADEVIRVGDFCAFGNKVGTVEDISLRSTRIRTLDRSVLSIPNGSLATMNIENFASRDKIQFSPTFGVSYETTPDQLRYLLAEVRRMLYEHPKVETESARIRLASLDNNALNLEIFSYILTADWDEFTAIREDVWLRIIEIVEKSGTRFAFSPRIVYLDQDSGPDKEKKAAAEKQVQQWRDQQQLPFPDFAADHKASFRDSMAYPPPESSVAKKRP